MMRSYERQNDCGWHMKRALQYLNARAGIFHANIPLLVLSKRFTSTIIVLLAGSIPFPLLENEELDIGTPSNPKNVYDPILQALNEAIASIVAEYDTEPLM